MEIQIISKGSSCKIFHEGKSGMLQKINLLNVMGRYDVIILNEEDFVTIEGERYNCMLPVFAQSSEYEMVTQLNSLFEGLDGTFEYDSTDGAIKYHDGENEYSVADGTLNGSNHMKRILGKSGEITSFVSGPRFIYTICDQGYSPLRVVINDEPGTKNIVSITFNSFVPGVPFNVNGGSTTVNGHKLNESVFKIVDEYGEKLELRSPLIWNFMVEDISPILPVLNEPEPYEQPEQTGDSTIPGT